MLLSDRLLIKKIEGTEMSMDLVKKKMQMLIQIPIKIISYLLQWLISIIQCIKKAMLLISQLSQVLNLHQLYRIKH